MVSLGCLVDADRAAANALDSIARHWIIHPFKRAYAECSAGYAAACAALRGDDATAAKHFGAALALAPDGWLFALRGARHCTWLARRREFDRARDAAEKHARSCAERGVLHFETFALAAQGQVERLAWAAGDPGRQSLDQMVRYAREAITAGRRSGYHFYLTYALLEGGHCAVMRAEHDATNRTQSVAEANRYLNEAEQRAKDAGYRLILADLHVARAHLAWLAGDSQKMRDQCQHAIAICNQPDCGYAWARQDAEALLARTDPPPNAT